MTGLNKLLGLLCHWAWFLDPNAVLKDSDDTDKATDLAEDVHFALFIFKPGGVVKPGAYIRHTPTGNATTCCGLRVPTAEWTHDPKAVTCSKCKQSNQYKLIGPDGTYSQCDAFETVKENTQIVLNM